MIKNNNLNLPNERQNLILQSDRRLKQQQFGHKPVCSSSSSSLQDLTQKSRLFTTDTDTLFSATIFFFFVVVFFTPRKSWELWTLPINCPPYVGSIVSLQVAEYEVREWLTDLSPQSVAVLPWQWATMMPLASESWVVFCLLASVPDNFSDGVRSSAGSVLQGVRWGCFRMWCSSASCPSSVKWCFTSTETVGLLGTGAQDGHLDFHTVPELCRVLLFVLHIYTSNNNSMRKTKQTKTEKETEHKL